MKRAPLLVGVLAGLAVTGWGGVWLWRSLQAPGPSASPASLSKALEPIHGEPISETITAAPAASGQEVGNDTSDPAMSVMEDGYQRLPFQRLSDFPFEVFEVPSETGGRPLLRSTNTIPDRVRALDGHRVAVNGFVLALRLRKGRITEFLLLRDQGTCCFGQAAQINHFMRVTLKLGTDGLAAGTVGPVTVYGRLHVGETYVQGYLTGIYAMDAERVELEDGS